MERHIQKQAKQHHAHLHQLRQKYLKPETRETVKRTVLDVTLNTSASNAETRKTYDIDAVNHALTEMSEEFYNLVLGSSGKRAGNQIRYGNKGSFSVHLSGAHAGSWHSFETDEGGYPLQLLMNSTYGWGLSFKDALEEGARLAGISPKNIVVSDQVRAQQVEQQRSRHDAKQKMTDQELLKRQEKIAAARYYWNSAKPINGTLAEIYLREVRGLQGDLSAFKYHPRIKDPNTKLYYPGIVVSAKNQEGNITAVQTILLGKDGRKAAKENGLEVIKRSRGVVKGSAVLIHDGKKDGAQQVVIAEGPETAASLITALPDAHIYITLGNISNAAELDWLAQKHQTKQLYFAADNDGAYGKSIEKIHDVAQKLHAQHRIECYFAKPYLPGKGVADKIDFNDVLLEKGVDEVKHQVKHFEKIRVKSLEMPLDEKTINEGFKATIDEWKRLETQYHLAFKGLASSHDSLTNPNYPEHLKKSSQETYNRHLETIYCDNDLSEKLKKVAPNVAKIVKEQGDELGLKINFLDPKFQQEWTTLSLSNNPSIKKITEDHDFLKKNNNFEMQKMFSKFLHEKMKKAFNDKTVLAELKLKAPQLMQQAEKYHERALKQDRGKSR